MSVVNVTTGLMLQSLNGPLLSNNAPCRTGRPESRSSALDQEISDFTYQEATSIVYERSLWLIYNVISGRVLSAISVFY